MSDQPSSQFIVAAVLLLVVMPAWVLFVRWLYRKGPSKPAGAQAPLDLYLHERMEALLQPDAWKAATQDMRGSQRPVLEGLPFEWDHWVQPDGRVHDQVMIRISVRRVGYLLTAHHQRLFLQNVKSSWPQLWNEVHKDDPKSDEQIIESFEAVRPRTQTKQGSSK